MEPAKESALDSLFEDLPTRLDASLRDLDRIQSAFRLRVAKHLEQILNANIIRPELESPEPHVRAQIASTVNDAVEQFGMVTIDPTTKRPGILSVAHHSDISSYNYHYPVGKDGYGVSPPFDKLKPVKLQPAPVDFDAWARRLGIRRDQKTERSR